MTPTLAAGTIIEYSIDLQTPVFIEVDGIIDIGEIGLASEAKEKTTLKDTQKKYAPGLSDAADKTLKGQFDDNDAVQQTFLDACDARTPMLMRVTLPNKPSPTGTGTRYEFEFQPLGLLIDEPSAEEWLMFTVPGKQNTKPVKTPPSV